LVHAERVECVSDADEFEHYDLDDDAQTTSTYQQIVAGILKDLNDHRDTVFATLNLTPNFRMFASDHGY